MFVGATSNGILGLAQPGRRRVKAGGRHIRQQWFEQPTRGATQTRKAQGVRHHIPGINAFFKIHLSERGTPDQLANLYASFL